MKSPSINTRCVNPRKEIFDIAPTTLDKAIRYYVNVRSDEIEDLTFRTSVSPDAKWTWLRLKMLMTGSEQSGILIEDGKPIPTETLAVILNRRPTSIPKLQREIDELLAARVLRMHKGFIYDYILLSDEWSRFRREQRNSGKDPESFEEVLRKFPKVFPKFSQNSPGGTSGSINSESSSRTTRTTTATELDKQKDAQGDIGSPNGAESPALKLWENT
jgi:hypothetical protein